VKGGFNLLLGGANFVDCRYDYVSTATCPGHATLFTGAYPEAHGIVANDWYDPARYRRVYCVEDPDTTVVGGAPGPGFSPRNLKGSTLGDELRMANAFQSKVVAIALKDRASVLPGGHTGNAAYWYDVETGHFVTSTYYMQKLPDWALRFNDTQPAKPYCGKPWQALPETPDAGGKVLKRFSPDENEPCPDGKFIGWLQYTPFMNEIEFNFAKEAIRNERLGQGPATDLLAISLSANDYIGHAFGPYSPEVADTTLRTDRYLADFLGELDRAVGLDNMWIVLSADHGVAPNPQFIKEHNLGAGRVSVSALEKTVDQALSKAFGKDQWVQDTTEFFIALNPVAIKNHNVEKVAAESVAAEAATSVPGIRAAFTRTQLLTGNLPGTPLARKAFNSFNSQRSGDILYLLDAFAVPVLGDIETTHGSVWNYDGQVPMVFWGGAFKPGHYASPSQPIDLAPTLAVALGLTQPSGAQGRPLTEALK
jgi:predicted AlkP superfamily pyrophosphatase or phosphodiesterase